MGDGNAIRLTERALRKEKVLTIESKESQRKFNTRKNDQEEEVEFLYRLQELEASRHITLSRGPISRSLFVI